MIQPGEFTDEEMMEAEPVWGWSCYICGESCEDWLCDDCEELIDGD